MKIRIGVFICLIFQATASVIGQNLTSFVFSAMDDGHYIPLESVHIMNLTRNTDTTLFWPDTVLNIYNTNASSLFKTDREFKVFQNTPNPVSDKTHVKIYLPLNGDLTIMISDLKGQVIAQYSWNIAKGYSDFSFSLPKAQTYLLTALYNSEKKSVKIISSSGTGDCKITYEGTERDDTDIKSIVTNNSFLFSSGDSLKFTGKVSFFDDVIFDAPVSSNTYTFSFTTHEDLRYMLSGGSTKTWKLLRSGYTPGRYPLEVGPSDHSVIWWAVGYNNQEYANRPCMWNDEFILGDDFSLILDLKGDYWAEGNIFYYGNICASTSDPMIGVNGDDLSAWVGGNFNYSIDMQQNVPQITADGIGAYLGFYKLGNNAETMVPLEYVTYNIVELYDGAVDTLVIEGNYVIDSTLSGYWRFVLVHYDDPLVEPPLPGYIPETGFIESVSGRTVSFTNTSVFAESYLWEFGDGETSTEVSPVHTYATDNIYRIKLTGYNASGIDIAVDQAFCTTAVLTDDLLQNGTWRVRVDEYSVFVGPGLGNSQWWHVTESMLTNSTPDDWSCMPDDKFNFISGGIYTYETMGYGRNDSYFGYPNGCWSDEEIANSPGAPFGTCMTHTYTFIPADEFNRAIIILTNGPDHAAFIGFYKGYYGGENVDNSIPPNGGFPTNRYEVMGYLNNGEAEYLFVSVDISYDHLGTAAWSMILERLPDK